MEHFCRNGGTCRWDHSLRTLLLAGVLGFWIQRVSGQESPAGVITAVVGDTVTIAIPFTGEIFTYTWYRGTAMNDNDQAILTYRLNLGQSLGPRYTGRETGLPDGSLQITDVLTNYTGNYTRNIVLQAGSPITSTRQLRVYEAVSKPVIHPEPPAPIEHGTLTLFCNASGTAVSYQWYRADTEVVSDGHISLSANKQILTLSNCSKSDTGTIFTCRASNDVSNSSSNPYNVIISYGPATTIISVSTGERFYAEGSPLILSCSAASYPPALYTWLHNGHSSVVGQNITINSLTLSDSGNYTCNSTNNVTQLSNSATLEIFVLELVSQPTVSINDSQPIENQPVALTCDNSNSATTILWFFNNSPLQPDNNRITLSADNKTLTFPRVSRSDDGSYQCEAQNPVSSHISDPQTVTVSFGPDLPVIAPSQNVEVKVGTELRLTCTAASYPAAEYQWLHNDTNINNTHSTYTKASSAFDDSGSYTCLASNSITGLSTNVSAIVKVSVTGPPGSGISGGAIAGIVVAVVAVVIAVIVSVWYFFFKRPASGALKGEHTERNGTSPPSNPNASPSGKANGPAEDIQYTTVKFAPKTEKVAMPAAPEGTVYSEVRRK